MHEDLLPSTEQHQTIMMLKNGQKTRDFIGTGRYDKTLQNAYLDC